MLCGRAHMKHRTLGAMHILCSQTASAVICFWSRKVFPHGERFFYLEKLRFYPDTIWNINYKYSIIWSTKNSVLMPWAENSSFCFSLWKGRFEEATKLQLWNERVYTMNVLRLEGHWWSHKRCWQFQNNLHFCFFSVQLWCIPHEVFPDEPQIFPPICF